jgi:hypothetical protein
MIRASFGRLPFNPEPTSATTWPTSIPALVAHSVNRPHLPIQIGTPIMAGHPRIQHHTLVTRRCDVDQDRARGQPPKRHRHPNLTHPPIRRLRVHTHRPRPRRQLHNSQPNTHSLTNTHIHPRLAQQLTPPAREPVCRLRLTLDCGPTTRTRPTLFQSFRARPCGDVLLR